MANRYWTKAANNGTGTWDASDTTNWSTSSGGAGGASVPGVSDAVIFNANSFTAVTDKCTVNTNFSVVSVTCGAMGGILDFSVNNNSPTMQTFSNAGTGTRTLNMGSGTWTVTGSGVNIWTANTTTNLTLTHTGTINFTYSGGTGTRTVFMTAGGVSGRYNNVNITAGTDIFTIGSATMALTNLDFTGFSGSFAGTAALQLYGNMTLASTMTVTGTQQLNALGTSGTQVLKSNGVAWTGLFTINGVAGTVQLFDAWNMSDATKTFTLTNGTFDANNKNVTTGIFSSSNSNTRVLTMGSGTWTLTGNAATIWTTSTTTGLTLSGLSATVNCTYNGSTGTRTISTGSSSVVRIGNFNITAGSDAVTFTAASVNSNFTGYTGQMNPNFRVSGNLTMGTGMTILSGTNGIIFDGSSGTQLLTMNGVQANVPFTVTATTGITTQLQDSLDMGGASARTLTLTTGNFNAANFNVTCGIFSSSNANTRVLTMGSGTWTLTGNNSSVFNIGTSTNLTITGSGLVKCTYSGATGTRTINLGTPSATVSINNLSISAGTDTVSIQQAGTATGVSNIDFTGFAGTLASGAGTDLFIGGNLTLGTGMTTNTDTRIYTFTSTSGTKTITSNGVQLKRPITLNGVGGTWTLADAISIDQAIGLTNGTFSANNQDVTAASFSSSNSNIRTLTMGSGTWTLTGTGTVWNTATATNLTFTDLGTTKITDTSAADITFSGGGLTFNNLWWSRGTSANSNIMIGSNTFADFKDDGTVAHSIIFSAATTTTVTTWNVTGSLGNLITINSDTTATHNLVKSGGGVISSDYLSIQHSVATPTATWVAGANSTNNQAVDTAGSGWIFAPDADSYIIYNPTLRRLETYANGYIQESYE